MGTELGKGKSNMRDTSRASGAALDSVPLALKIALITALVFAALLFSVLVAGAQETSSASSSSSADTGNNLCKGQKLNPYSDICWNCMFPMKVAGVTTVPGQVVDAPSMADYAACVCPTPWGVRYGFTLSYWEPARFIETVKVPNCFPSVGKVVGGEKKSDSGSSSSDSGSSGSDDSGSSKIKGQRYGTHSNIGNEGTLAVAFQNAHYWTYPVWSTMDLMTDMTCTENSALSVGWMTEKDPTWHSDKKAMWLAPESLLLAEPHIVLACIADAIAASVPKYGLSLPPLFWCMGAWGLSYPMNGHIGSERYTQANVGISARLLYKMFRTGLECDTAIWLCACTYTPIWVKWHYRFQIARPVVDNTTCEPLGRPASFWDYGKNPGLASALAQSAGMASSDGGKGDTSSTDSGGSETSSSTSATGGGVQKGSPDNFLWMLFRKRACCVL